MKKLLFGLPLLMIGCAQFKEAATDGLNAAKDTLTAPPGFVLEALQAIAHFLGNALSAFADMFFHKFLPF